MPRPSLWGHTHLTLLCLLWLPSTSGEGVVGLDPPPPILAWRRWTPELELAVMRDPWTLGPIFGRLRGGGRSPKAPPSLSCLRRPGEWRRSLELAVSLSKESSSGGVGGISSVLGGGVVSLEVLLVASDLFWLDVVWSVSTVTWDGQCSTTVSSDPLSSPFVAPPTAPPTSPLSTSSPPPFPPSSGSSEGSLDMSLVLDLRLPAELLWLLHVKLVPGIKEEILEEFILKKLKLVNYMLLPPFVSSLDGSIPSLSTFPPFPSSPSPPLTGAVWTHCAAGARSVATPIKIREPVVLETLVLFPCHHLRNIKTSRVRTKKKIK